MISSTKIVSTQAQWPQLEYQSIQIMDWLEDECQRRQEKFDRLAVTWEVRPFAKGVYLKGLYPC